MIESQFFMRNCKICFAMSLLKVKVDHNLTLVLVNPKSLAFANIIDPDQLASDLDLHCFSLSM